jgi:two-component system response regulator AtoC
VASAGDDDDLPNDNTKTRTTNTGYVLRVAANSNVLSFPIPPTGKVCLGRGIGTDVRIPLPDMSRRHAMLGWEEGRLQICDLGSSNGTMLRGKRLEPDVWTPLDLRELFFVADAALVVHKGSTTDGPKRLVGHEPVEAAVRACLTSYAKTKKPFGVLAVDAESDMPWSDLVVALFATTDIAGFLSETSLRMLLLDRSVEQLELVTAFLQKTLVPFSPTRKVSLRVCPRDGDTLPALYSTGRKRADTARSDTRRPSAPVIESSVMRKVYVLIDEVARTPTSILLLGETGVGKDVMAREIHQRSERSAAMLVGLNCAALPESLLESELFGYERGAFTGAVAPKPGLIESAEGGTVFLDEVGEMPLSTQAKLLRVLEERKVMRLGGLKPRAVDFRLIAATNRKIQAEIAAGRFRADLFYRINGFSIMIPPLRDRRDEIVPLALYFAQRAAFALGKSVPIFATETLACFERYAWPGNIRELRSVVERAILLARTGVVMLEHLPEEVISQAASRPPPPPSHEIEPTTARNAAIPPLPSLAANEDDDDDDDDDDEDAPRFLQTASPLTAPTSAKPPSSASLREQVERLEYEKIVAMLNELGGNQTRTAQALGMTRRALIIRLERYGLPRPRKAKGTAAD